MIETQLERIAKALEALVEITRPAPQPPGETPKEETPKEEPKEEEVDFSMSFGSKKPAKKEPEEPAEEGEKPSDKESSPAPADLTAIRAAYRKKSGNSKDITGLKAKWGVLFEDYDIGNIAELTKDQLEPFLKELQNL
jgi:hypothetical protein